MPRQSSHPEVEMKAPSGPTNYVVFECSDRRHAGQIPIDENMRKIMRQIDGHRSLASVAFSAGLTMAELQEAIRALVLLGLIVPIES